MGLALCSPSSTEAPEAKGGHHALEMMRDAKVACNVTGRMIIRARTDEYGSWCIRLG